MISYRRVQKENELLHIVWSLVMVRETVQFPKYNQLSQKLVYFCHDNCQLVYQG